MFDRLKRDQLSIYRNFKGNLSRAASPNQNEIVSLLISAGAQVNALTTDQLTPLTLSNGSSNTALSRLLKKAGGKSTRDIALKQIQIHKKKIFAKVASFRKDCKLNLDSMKYLAALLNEMEAYSNFHPVGWIPTYKKISAFEKPNRLGNLVFAHLYTSEKHPWPKYKRKNLAPLLQLDLKDIRKIFSRSNQTAIFPDVDGLLQVWTKRYQDTVNPFTDGIVRVIPRCDVRMDQITSDIPHINFDDYLCLPSCGLGSKDGFGASIAGWIKTVPKFAAVPRWATVHQCKLAEEETPGTVTAAEFELLEDICNQFDKLIELLPPPVVADGGTQLFGISRLFMENAWELYFEYGEQNLFQFDGDGEPDLRIGGSGTAQVTWKNDKFSFSIANY